MTLSYQQTKMVKSTIPMLQDHGEELASIFYRDMITAHPELNNYFNTANQKNGRQPRALTSVILHFAKNVSDMGEIVPKLERVCQKHCSLGIRPDLYWIVGKYLLQAFGVVLGPAMTPQMREAWTRAYWTLARMLIAREAQLYRDFGGWTGYRKFSVSRKVQECDDGIWSLYLAPADGRVPLPPFLPGQYVSVQVHVPGLGYGQSRQYALSDAPREDCYRITVQRDQGSRYSNSVAACYFHPGLVSNYLVDRVSAGDVLDVSHPAGEFHLDTDQSSSSVPLVLVSAGVGVAPLMSILNAVAETQPCRVVSWIYGSRKGIPFEHHVELAQHRLPNLRINFFGTELATAPLAGVENKKYDYRIDLQQVDRDDLFLNHGGTEYYICGPEQFMVEMNDYLLAERVQPVRIHMQLLSTGDLTFHK